MIVVKGAYEPASRADGVRFLVERLWPRGIAKADLVIDEWLKDVGPSPGLRKWFGHDPDRWDEFRRRYFRELDSCPEAWKPIVSAVRRGGTVTFLLGGRTQRRGLINLQTGRILSSCATA